MTEGHYEFLRALCLCAGADPFCACEARALRDALGISDADATTIVRELHSDGLVHSLLNRTGSHGPVVHITPAGIEYVLRHEA